LALAEADAYSRLDCSHSTNEQFIHLWDKTDPSGGMAEPYPSVKYIHESGTVGQVIVTLKEFEHEWMGDAGIYLMSPSGTVVQLMLRCSEGMGYGMGQPHGRPPLTLTIRDDADEYMPQFGLLESKAYKPTRYVALMPLGIPIIEDPKYHHNQPLPDTLSAFIGEPMQGPWALFVYDQLPLYRGNIRKGWDITIIPA